MGNKDDEYDYLFKGKDLWLTIDYHMSMIDKYCKLYVNTKAESSCIAVAKWSNSFANVILTAAKNYVVWKSFGLNS